MFGKPLCLMALVALLATGIAMAQDQAKAPKLYRWVDKQGKVHYDQALPPEAVNEARREFSAKTGTATGSVDRALTDEERAQQAAADQAALAAEEAVNELKRQEEIMMTSYATEADLRRAYGERISLLEMTLEATDISIKSLRENMATILAQASDAELQNRKLVDDQVKTLLSLHAEKVRQQAMQQNRRLELQQMNAEFARMLTRYRELRGANAAPVPATPAEATAGPATAQ